MLGLVGKYSKYFPIVLVSVPHSSACGHSGRNLSYIRDASGLFCFYLRHPQLITLFITVSRMCDMSIIRTLFCFNSISYSSKYFASEYICDNLLKQLSNMICFMTGHATADDEP